MPKNLVLTLLFAIFTSFSSSIASQTPIPYAFVGAPNKEIMIHKQGQNRCEFQLRNGMKVVLVPRNSENDDDVYVFLSAKGGYASLDLSSRASAELSPQIALESGVGELSGDQLAVHLWEHSIEFSPKIFPFYRLIEGITIPEEIQEFLEITKKFFTSYQFQDQAYHIVVNKKLDILNRVEIDYETRIDEVYKCVNSEGSDSLRRLKLHDCATADFEDSKRIFEYSFGDPSEFVCVIVGDFDLNKIKPMVEESLGTIPKKQEYIGGRKRVQIQFPKEIKKIQLPNPKHHDSLVRLTFPLTKVIEQEVYHSFTLSCEVLKSRIKKKLREVYHSGLSFNISCEFPMFPFGDSGWLLVQYRCSPGVKEHVTEFILNEINQVLESGITLEEFQEIKNSQVNSNEYWKKDNYCLGLSIMNYCLWGWDLEKSFQRAEMLQKVTREDIQQILEKSIDFQLYTIVTVVPES